MSFFNLNPLKEKDDRSLPWIKLERLDQLNDLIESSRTKPQIIFKHSTRCSISRMVLQRFEKAYPVDDNTVDLYFLDLIAFRPLSNAIAERLGVVHESPQMIILKDGSVVAHDSHSGINRLDLRSLLA